MRLTQPANVRLVNDSATSSSLAFSGERGERFQVSVLADDLIRVQMFPNGKARFQRTWMVVGKDGDVPREGRWRDDLTPFLLPRFERSVQEHSIHLRTLQLRLEISPGNFAINWFDAHGNSIASDLAGRAYVYDRAGTSVWHYLEHHTGEHYFGFGERSGELDKVGRRLRMLDLDAFVWQTAQNINVQWGMRESVLRRRIGAECARWGVGRAVREARGGSAGPRVVGGGHVA